MNDDNKISVVINTYNAERHLQQVIDAAKGFDEIVVCDMESTDNTVNIAHNNGCRVVTFEKRDYNIVEPARQFAIESATFSWVLVLDADEIVSKKLKVYLYEHISKPDCEEGVAIPRKNYFMGKFMHASYPDYILRFFKKDLTTWPPIIHASPIVKGRVIRLPRNRKDLAFEHLANDSIATLNHKNNVYSDNEISKRRDKHYGIGALLVRPSFRFIRAYILKGGFKDGVAGFIYAVWQGIYQFTIVAKIMEYKRKQND